LDKLTALLQEAAITDDGFLLILGGLIAMFGLAMIVETVIKKIRRRKAWRY
jgi:hypothetical protein